MKKNSEQIVEKKLGIPADYQYKALRNNFWAQRNWHRNKFEVVLEVLPLKMSDSVLDLGTGSGNFELLFARRLKRIVGVDYNDEAIYFLNNLLKNENISNVDLVCSDVRKLPLDVTKKKYDLIVIIDVIEHIRIEDADKLLPKLRLLLNEDGKLLIITPNYNSIWRLLEVLLDKVSLVPKFQGEQHLAKFTSVNLPMMLKEHHYKKIRVTSFNLFSYILPRRLNDIFLKWELRYLGDMGSLLTVVATK